MYKRYFSTKCVLKAPYFRTTISATPQLWQPTSSYKSVILLATPSVLPLVVKQAIELYGRGLQVIVAGIDTVKSQRHGVLELWLEHKAIINLFVEFVESDNNRESDGINIVTVPNKNWKLVPSSFKIHFKLMNQDSANVIDIPLANSLFTMSQIVTLFYLDNSQTGSDKILTELEISLPPSFKTTGTNIRDRWVPLTSEMVITESIGNLIKKINGKSASKYLEDNIELMTIASKETEIYVKINNVNRYQIIAGGGGWGPKADTLVLSANAKIRKGDTIQIFMLTPQDQKFQIPEADSNMEFECSVHETNYQLHIEPKEYKVFGCGSELGFKYNGIIHKSIGERFEANINL